VNIKKSFHKNLGEIDDILKEENINLNLSGFFRELSDEKKRKEEEFDSLVGELELNSLFEEVSNLKKEDNKKRETEQKTLQQFESFLYSKKSQKIKKPKKESISQEKINLQEEKSLGLLAEPSNIKQQTDTLTPLNQKFATLDDLQKHYNLFLNRIQQQLSTLGGGGETNLAFMDMPLTYVTSSSYSVTHRDYYIGVNYAGAVTITLPTSRTNGKVYIVKDELGEASKGTNRYITILPSGSDLIDGRDRAILAFDFGSLTFVYRNGWRVV
jgi:hypothetical protein